MPVFRKRPVLVFAEQWFPGKDVPGVLHGLDGEGPYVVTIHGQRACLAPGDWVITEPNDQGHYPCKPDVFAATYEPAYLSASIDTYGYPRHHVLDAESGSLGTSPG